jgi:hypothetical protein
VTQSNLFDDDPGNARLVPLGMRGSAATLSKAQKQFNKWLAKIDAQRREIDEWLAFGPVHVERCVRELEPLNERMRQRRIELAKLLDAALDGKGLSKRQRAGARDLLLDQLSLVLEESDDAELERLYDKHGDVSLAEQRQGEHDMLRDLVNEEFGVDIGDAESGADDGLQSWAQRIADKVREDDAQATASAPRKKGKKALEKERLREEAAKMAKQSVRDIFRKLASELHPDREPDPQERSRKTALMQEVNKAYEANDLLALLRLQLAIEQIDHASLAGIPDSRIEHFNEVLREQSQGLEQELQILTMPYVMAMDGRARKLTTAAVQAALSADIRDLSEEVSQLEADLVLFKDLRELKKFLNEIGTPQSDDELFLAFTQMLNSAASGDHGRGKRRKR